MSDLGVLGSDQASTAIRSAFSRMPYSGDPRLYAGEADALRRGSYRDPRPIHAIVAALDNLAGILRETTDAADGVQHAYTRLSNDVAAMRRVLGTE